MQDREACAIAALLGVALFSVDAVASAPAGVWAKVQKVVYAPDKANATRVQVHGAIMLFDGSSGAARPYPGYTPPALGYVYYECPSGQVETCRQEWSDIEANISAPATTCVGFGMNSLPTGTLRQPDSAATSPDAYPIQNGVASGFSPCQVLAQFLSANEGGAGGAGGAGGEASTGGAGASSGGKPANTGGTETSTAGTDAGPGGAGANSGGKSTVSGSAGTGAAKGGASASGRAGSSSSDPDPKGTEDASSDAKASGCSIGAATGAASIFGVAAAAGLVGSLFARRRRAGK